VCIVNKNQTSEEKGFSIDPGVNIGTVVLNVLNLDSQIDFYRNVLGFQLRWRKEDRVGLGTAGRELLVLKHRPAYKRYSGIAGLYHFAVLYPNQRELARAIGRLFSLKYPNSPTDHIMTKTTYLDDPDGNGIELYAESPEDGEWFFDGDTFGARRTDGSLSSGREPLDLGALFRKIQKGDQLDGPIHSDTRIGHIHLHTGDIDKALVFYHGTLGFDIMGVSHGIGMAFVSAGGYHHHIGLNAWLGKGIPPAPPDGLGLEYFTLELTSQVELEDLLRRVQSAGIATREKADGLQLSDPSGIGVLLRVK